MGLPTGDLNGAFWITIGGIVSALLGVLLKSMYKSKCSEVDLCCLDKEGHNRRSDRGLRAWITPHGTHTLAKPVK